MSVLITESLVLMAAASNEKQATPSYRIELIKDRVVVHTVYNQKFVGAARVVGGGWDKEQGTWSFPKAQQPMVENMCAHAFEGKEPAANYSIELKGDQVVVRAPFNQEFIDLARATGGEWDKEQRTWSFPKAQHPVVNKMCAYAFEGKEPEQTYHIGEAEGRVVVHSPFNQEFVDLARAAGGEWDKEQRTWSFSKAQQPMVEKMCAYAFEGKVPRKTMMEKMKVACKDLGRVSKVFLPVAAKSIPLVAVGIGFGMSGLRGAYYAKRLCPQFRRKEYRNVARAR